MEFLVDSVEEDGKVYCVRGACTQGSIEVGATFLQAYKKIRRFFNNEYELIRTENHRAIALKVARIIAYRHVLDSLPQGMSGAVYLIGDGGDCISENDTLTSE